MGPTLFTTLLASLLIGAADVGGQRRVIGREPPSTDGWRPVQGSTQQPRYSTQAVGHPVLDKLRAHLEDAERRKLATTPPPTPSVLASFSAVGPRRDQNAGFSGRLVPPPRDQPPPAAFPEDSRDLSAAQQTHPGPFYLHSLLPPPRDSDFLLEGPGAGSATSYVSFPPFSGDPAAAYYSGAKQQPQLYFPQQPQAQPQPQPQSQSQSPLDAYGSLPQRHNYYQQQQQPGDYLLSTQHRQHPSAVSSQYTSHQAIAAGSPGVGTGQAAGVFGGREQVSATPQQTSTGAAGSVTFHGNIRDEAAYLSASQGHRFQTGRPAASLGSFPPGPPPAANTQYPQQLYSQQQAYTPSYAEQPAHTSANIVGFTLGVSADQDTTGFPIAAGSQLETPAQRPGQFLQFQQPQQTFLREQPNTLQRPEGATVADKPGRKRRPPAGQKKPALPEATGEAPDARRPALQHTFVLQQQYQPETQQDLPVSWPPTGPQHLVPTAPAAQHQQVPTQQETTPGHRHEGRRRPTQTHRPEDSTHKPVQYQEDAGQRDTPRQHARRPPQRQHFAPSTPQPEQPTTKGEYRPHRRRRPTQTQQEHSAVTAPAEQHGAPQQEATIRHQQTHYQNVVNLQTVENAATAPGDVGEVPSAPSAPASTDSPREHHRRRPQNTGSAPGDVGEAPSAPSAPASQDLPRELIRRRPQNTATAPGDVAEGPSAPSGLASTDPPHEHLRRRPQNKQKYHITMDNDKRTVSGNDWEQAQNTVKPARPRTRRPVQKLNPQVNPATEENTASGNTYSQQRRRPVRPQHRNPPATTQNTFSASENYPETQRDEETFTNVANRPEETPNEDAAPFPEHVQNQAGEQQVFTRRPSTRYSTTESATQPAIESQLEGQSGQRTRVRQQHVSRRPSQGSPQEEPTTVAHYRRPVHPSRRPQYNKRVRPTRPPPEYESESGGQQEATNDPVSQSDNSGDYVQDYRLSELKKVQRQRYKRPQVTQNFAEDLPSRSAAAANAGYRLQSSSPLDDEDNLAVHQQTVAAPSQKVRQRISQQEVLHGKSKYHREPLSDTDSPLPEPTEQVFVEDPSVQTEPDFENDVLGGGADARFPSAVDYVAEEEESDITEPQTTMPTTTTSTTTTTTTTTTTPAPTTTRTASTVNSALEKLRQRSRYNATRPRFSVRDFQERLSRLSTSTAAPEAPEATEAAVSRFSGRTRASTPAPADVEAARPRPSARDPARVNSARYRASSAPSSTTAATPSTRYKYKSRYRSTVSTSSTTEEPTVATTVPAPTPSAIVSRPSLRTKGIFSAVRPNPLLRTATSVATTTSTTSTTTPVPLTTVAADDSANEADVPPSAPSAPGVFGVRTAEPSAAVEDELSQSRRIAELTLAAGPLVPSSATTQQQAPPSPPPQQTADPLSAYWAQQESSAPPALSPHFSGAEDEHAPSATTPDAASSYPATAADSVPDQSSASHQWTQDAVPPTQMIADLTSSASASDFFQKSVPSTHTLRITMATDDPILPLEAFFPSWGGKEDSARR